MGRKVLPRALSDEGTTSLLSVSDVWLRVPPELPSRAEPTRESSSGVEMFWRAGGSRVSGTTSARSRKDNEK